MYDKPSPHEEAAAQFEVAKQTEFAKYILDGIKNFETGRYDLVIKHFYNPEPAEKMGLSLTKNRQIFITGSELNSQEKVDAAAAFCARNSWFKLGSKKINPSGASIDGVGLENIYTENPYIKALQHEVALVCLEEWLHGLQFVLKKPLLQEENCEIDVAKYMKKRSIPMTAAFLRRYDRGLALNNDNGKDDSLSSNPSLRKGVFIIAKKSDGTTHLSWQVTGFNTTTGDPIVTDFKTKETRTLSREEFAQYNTEVGHNSPFNSVTNFTELYATFDYLGGVYSSSESFIAQELKYTLGEIRRGTAAVDTLPRSGGLRFVVKRLLEDT